MTGSFNANDSLFKESALILAIKAAERADAEFSAAVKAAGYLSRWDVSTAIKNADAAMKAAYDAKVLADVEVGRQFEADRMHRAGRNKSGNDISGI